MISLDQAFRMMNLSKGAQIVYYILKHTDGETKIFSKTYKEIQNATGASQPTIAKVFDVLEGCGALVRAGFGKWYVPAVIGYEPDDEEENWYITCEN